MQKLIRRVCAKIERCSTGKINWIRTLYFNFRILPFRIAKILPFYIYGKPAFNNLSGAINFKCPIKRGMVKINEPKIFAPSIQTINSQINISGTLIIRGESMVGCGTKIIIAKGAVLDIGRCTKITDFCNIDCWEKIVIGDGSTIAHRSQIMDSNHHFILKMKERTISNNKRAIVIGKQCWICNSSTLTGGTVLPDFTIVGSNSLVNKDFSQEGGNILIGGIPAKIISKDIFRIYDQDKEDELIAFFNNSKEKIYHLPIDMDIDTFKGGRKTLD